MKDINVSSSIILYNKFKRFLWPFGKRIPLITDSNLFTPFFIIGSGRSGTTLLRAMLNQHSAVVIPPESFVLPILYKRSLVYDRLPWKDFVKIILGEFAVHNKFFTWHMDITPCFSQLAELPEEERSLNAIIAMVYKGYGKAQNKEVAFFGDKTPLNTFYIQYLEKMFDRPKYIHMYRDGRDVAASFIKNQIFKSVDDVAERWLASIDKAESFKREHPDRLLEIRYEDLVSDTRKHVSSICKFLDLAIEPSMFSHQQNTESLGDSFYSHHQNLQKPVNDRSVGSWKTVFSPKEQERLNAILKPKLTELGYL